MTIGKFKSLLVSKAWVSFSLPVTRSKIGTCEVIVDSFLLEYTLETGVLGLSFLIFGNFAVLEILVGSMDSIDGFLAMGIMTEDSMGP